MNPKTALYMENEGKTYTNLLVGLKEKIRLAQLRAVLTVNAELLGIYHDIGRTISEQEKGAGWGAKIIDKLARDLNAEFPEMKGFSTRNLRYMREFFEAYPFPILQPVVAKLEMDESLQVQYPESTDNQYFEILQPLVAKLPWSHHTVILTRTKTLEERTYYVTKCIENGWSKAVLTAQIETQLHRRQGNSLNNFNVTLPSIQSDLANAALKNPYIFDFLALGEKLHERGLENALIQHLKKFMLELGKGFSYVGNQYRLTVEEDEYILDLLFYNIPMHAFVLFELKLVAFQPEFAGKLNFYINAVDAQLKGPGDNPTIGVLLCKTPNSTVVKYALNGINSPIGISDYQLSEALPKQLQSDMPSIEDLEAEMDKEYEELKKPEGQKLERVKALMQSLKQKESKVHRSKENVLRIFDQLLVPLRLAILDKLEPVFHEFHEVCITLGN
jgi:predicted nuclease of restriction endonuclease-like (RecB) superfamily